MKARPAETAGGAGSLALLVGYALGVQDPAVLTAVGAVVGLVPAAVTLVVRSGGIRGCWAKIWGR